MPGSKDQIPSLGEAATLYLARLSGKDREISQAEIYKFARWYGWESPFSRLAGPAVASYAEQLNVTDIDYEKKIGILRSFFAHAKKAGWSQTNLATHLKAKKGKNVAVTGRQDVIEAATLTQQRYDELAIELNNLKKRSRELVAEIQHAAADKDFRENAPLDAAKEERGHIEGRIKEIGQILKSANIIQEKKEPARKSGIGDTLIVCDLISGEECRYMIVDPREVNAASGKISTASPLGKALLGRSDGETVEITAPAGKLRYQIKHIER
ncbi:MAG: transcription elongation factor GreA [Dehalococcoidales bacterium]|nr:transcription elongation factor GreA [Dehalococcoidales bacterium]